MATKKMNKSAKNGQTVTTEELKKNPNETYQQTVQVKKKKPKK
jgi:hypothetical protein